MLSQTYYNSLFRKYVTLFGSLFDDIQITRTNPNTNVTELVKVPITYAPKDKMISRVLQDPDIDRKTETPTLPLMSFEMGNISYDGNRKLQSSSKIAFKTDPNNFNYVYTPVPYNIDFKLYVFVKNTEDGLKIVEEILPYFTPDFTVKLALIPNLEELRDIPVILRNVNMEDNYEGKIEKRRDIIWTLDFSMKAYFYGPTFKAPIIKYSNVSFYAYPANNYSYVSNNQSNYAGSVITSPGLTSNGQPTSNSQLSVNNNVIEVTDDYGFIVERIYG